MRLLCTRLPPVLEIYGVDESQPFRDLAPSILRQRLVIEGTRARPISAEEIRDYLVRLSYVCAMNVLLEPVTHRSDRFGWAGWVHWETSGAHFYAWDEPFVFFSVDIYTCKAFDAQRAVEFTRSYFDADEVVAKEF
jgi:S-adenosylmethionine/arginine decarboxylase-like enzyme